MFIAPAIPTASITVPTGSGWLHQPKFDGWRAQVHRVGRGVRIFTRGGHDVTERIPTLADGLRALPPGCVLDCELVLPEGAGVDFYGLTRACWPGRDQALALVAFDVLRVRGRDVREDPLEARLERLQGLLAQPVAGITICDAFPDGVALLQACEAHGHEGIVSKRKGARYAAGRCGSWRKTKTAAWRAANAERWRAFA